MNQPGTNVIVFGKGYVHPYETGRAAITTPVGVDRNDAMAKEKTKKPTWLKVKSSISKFDKAKLIKLLRDLYNLSEDNKNFLNARLSLVKNPTAPYKKIIRACLYPDIMEEEGCHLYYDKLEGE